MGQPGESGLFKLQWPEEGEQKQQGCSDTDKEKGDSYAWAGEVLTVLVCEGQPAKMTALGHHPKCQQL